MLTKEMPILKLDIDDTTFEEVNEIQEQSLQTVEFEVLPPVDISDTRKLEIYKGIADIDERLDFISARVAELNSEIDTLTNHADGFDYAVAVISGIITGIIDSVFVGEWNFENAKAVTNKEVNSKVAEFVKKDPRYIPWCNNTSHGRKARDPNRLETAMEFLEEKYPLPGDDDWNNKKKLVNFAKTKGFNGKGYDEALKFMNENFPIKDGWGVPDLQITASTHRLDDFCHHPTLIGMLCSIIVQFTGETIYSHNAGKTINIPIVVNEYGKFVGNNPLTKVMSGVINWFITCAGTINNQKGHLMSDIATSAGIPGSLFSTLKELSALPCFKDKKFSENLRKAYQNGIGNGKKQVDLGIFNQLFEGASSKFDKRTEMAIGHELKRQAVPVIINEALVRGFYFVRKFIEQIRIKNSISEIEWKKVLPFKNRTIIRMLTISTGTFTAFDVADAVIRSGGFNASCILRVNFVGVGRFAIALGTDVAMGIKKNKKENERMTLRSEELNLLNAKVFYKQADMWIEAENTEKAIQEAYRSMETAVNEFSDAWEEIQSGSESRKRSADAIRENNKDFANDLLDTLEWGI